VKDEKGLERLIELARRGRASKDDEAPFGFATRVASRALSVHREDGLFVWERLAGWGAALAVAVCVLTTALHQRAPKHSALADFAGVNQTSENPWQ
jgi:hypothetical protein